MNPTFTIGIEEEYQTVDPVSRDLRSHIHAEIIEKGKLLLQERVKAEMHQSVVEVGTSVCNNIKDAKIEVKKLRRDMITLARENGLRLASAATHPFADWRVQEITPGERYKNIVEDMQLVARANLIFGLHVHIGVEDRETAIHMMNHARYFLPHILALSTNSPFWLGMDTGLKSYRCKVFDKFPRTNIPDYFPSWGEYESFIKLLIKTNCIDNAKKIWWDIRPHPFFNTHEYLEFVDDVVDELDSREELNYIREILEMGSGADRQLRVFQETADLKKVVDYIIEETEVGLAETESASARKVG